MRLQDIMTTQVETVSPQTSAEDAWNQMQFRQIHHLVVLDKNRIVGIIAEHDLGGKQGDSFRHNRRVADLMTPNPLTANQRMTVKEAANELRGYTISAIPVVDNNKLVGMVTITDLLELIGRGLDRASTRKERRTESGQPIYRRQGMPQVK